MPVAPRRIGSAGWPRGPLRTTRRARDTLGGMGHPRAPRSPKRRNESPSAPTNVGGVLKAATLVALVYAGWWTFNKVL